MYIIQYYRYNVLQQICRTYSSCLTETLFPPLARPWQTLFHSLTLNLTILLTSCKADHAIFVCVWLLLTSVRSCAEPEGGAVVTTSVLPQAARLCWSHQHSQTGKTEDSPLRSLKEKLGQWTIGPALSFPW